MQAAATQGLAGTYKLNTYHIPKVILWQVDLHTNMCSALVDMFTGKPAARGFRDIPGHPTGAEILVSMAQFIGATL